MKIKSVSVENLGNIVKQIIKAALEDSDQIMKLHQAIYEEWYFKKMMELGDTRSKTKNVEDIRKIDQEVLLCPSSSLTRRLSIEDSTDTSNEINDLPKQDLDNTKIIDHDKFAECDVPVTCNKSVETNVCIEYRERICEISGNQKCIVNNNIVPNLKIIEVWNNSTQRAKIRKKQESNIIKHQNREQTKGKLIRQVKRRLSFESWKKEKNLTYKKLLIEAEEKKQQELQKKLKDIEHKKASQEAYIRIIKEKEAQQRMELSAKQLQAIQQTNTEILQKQIDERRIINDQAFNAWKRQKDLKLKEVKLLTMENAPYHQLKKSADPTLTERPSSQFDLWLDQLDNVLHKRYLRERRHLVRSFYCQPIYYGAASTCYT